MNPHPITQSEATDNFRRHKNVLRGLHEIALRVPQESKTLARDFDDAVAEFRFALDLTVRGRTTIAEIALGAARLIGSLFRMLVAFPALDGGNARWSGFFFDSVRRSV